MSTGPTIRLTEAQRNSLVTLKRRTGLTHWNTLCRWALALSLSEPSRPADPGEGELSSVELAWATLGGTHAPVYLAMLHQRMAEDGIDPRDPTAVATEARRHLARGIGALVGRVRSLADLLRLSDSQGVLL